MKTIITGWGLRIWLASILASFFLVACESVPGEMQMLDIGPTIIADQSGALDLRDQVQVTCFMKKIRNLAPTIDLTDTKLESLKIKHAISNRSLSVEFKNFGTQYIAHGYLASDDLFGDRGGIDFYPIEVIALSNSMGSLSVSRQEELWNYVDPVLVSLSAAAQNSCSTAMS